MSLDINQIALHQLIKRDEQNLELVLRDSLLEPTETVVEMVAELHRVYSAKNKAYGLFSEESELAQTLRLQRQGEEDFLAFSRAATGRLRDELAKYPFADGGFVLFCHYRYLAVEYLLVAVLSNLSSMRVNENLDINPTHYLDINHADIVARIDLTEWETNPESTRYLTFLKGRVGRKVADFFMDYMYSRNKELHVNTSFDPSVVYTREELTQRIADGAYGENIKNFSDAVDLVSSWQSIKDTTVGVFGKDGLGWGIFGNMGDTANEMIGGSRVAEQYVEWFNSAVKDFYTTGTKGGM